MKVASEVRQTRLLTLVVSPTNVSVDVILYVFSLRKSS